MPKSPEKRILGAKTPAPPVLQGHPFPNASRFKLVRNINFLEKAISVYTYLVVHYAGGFLLIHLTSKASKTPSVPTSTFARSARAKLADGHSLSLSCAAPLWSLEGYLFTSLFIGFSAAAHLPSKMSTIKTLSETRRPLSFKVIFLFLHLLVFSTPPALPARNVDIYAD